jgi:hypothetical protein
MFGLMRRQTRNLFLEAQLLFLEFGNLQGI